MIRLDSITRKLQAKMGAAKNSAWPVVTVSYYDQNSAGNITKGATQLAILNDTTLVDICDAPPQNVVRNIDTITAHNIDAVTQTIVVEINAGSSSYRHQAQALAPNETLHYEHGAGWQVL